MAVKKIAGVAESVEMRLSVVSCLELHGVANYSATLRFALVTRVGVCTVAKVGINSAVWHEREF